MLYHEDYMNHTIAGALVEGILPALIDAIAQTAQSVAAQVVTDRKPTGVDVYLTKQALVYGLLEYLDNSKQDPGRDWTVSASHPRQVFELEDPEFARRWFASSIADGTYPETIIDVIAADAPTELDADTQAALASAIVADDARRADRDQPTGATSEKAVQ